MTAANYLTRTCRDCIHWENKGPDPEDHLSGDYGECRNGLHLIAVPVPQKVDSLLLPHQRNMPRMQLMAMYARTPAEFPACSGFAYPQRPDFEVPHDPA